MTTNVDSLSVLGTRVSLFNSPDHTVGVVRERVRSHLPTFCVAINPEKVYRAKYDSRLRQTLNSADVQLCDGVGVTLAARLLYRTRISRFTGIDLFLTLLDVAAEEGWSIFLLGASPEANAAARRSLVRRFPGLKIAGSQHGYFEDSTAVIENVNHSGADLLFVAMGSPRQEYWISENMPRLKPRLCMGVGGSLDVVGGMVKRAPEFFQKTGTEWLFRLVSQPSRLARQVALPKFALDVLREAWTVKSGKPATPGARS